MIGLTPELAVWLIAYTFITTFAIHYGAVATNSLLITRRYRFISKACRVLDHCDDVAARSSVISRPDFKVVR